MLYAPLLFCIVKLSFLKSLHVWLICPSTKAHFQAAEAPLLKGRSLDKLRHDILIASITANFFTVVRGLLLHSIKQLPYFLNSSEPHIIRTHYIFFKIVIFFTYVYFGELVHNNSDRQLQISARVFCDHEVNNNNGRDH